MAIGLAETSDAAIAIGKEMISYGILQHVAKDHGFENSYLFYRFTNILENSEDLDSDILNPSSPLGELVY